MLKFPRTVAAYLALRAAHVTSAEWPALAAEFTGRLMQAYMHPKTANQRTLTEAVDRQMQIAVAVIEDSGAVPVSQTPLLERVATKDPQQTAILVATLYAVLQAAKDIEFEFADEDLG